MQNTVRALMACSPLDRVDTRVLLQHVLEVNHAWLITRADTVLPTQQIAYFWALVKRRQQGEPVAYLTGEREFYGLVFTVTPDVLIPRAETELLVDLAVQACGVTQVPLRILDLGTGCGAIAVSIAKACPNARIVATDQSVAALAVAEKNARRHGVQIDFFVGDWFTAVPDRRFDLIVANPPYIAQNDVHLQRGDLRFEPKDALTDYSVDGLQHIDHIITHAPFYLNQGGVLWLEHGYDQAQACRAHLIKHGFTAVRSIRDLSQIERVSGGVYVS